MEAAGDEEYKENERVALNEPYPWKMQYVVCYEPSWSLEQESHVLMPEFPSVAEQLARFKKRVANFRIDSPPESSHSVSIEDRAKSRPPQGYVARFKTDTEECSAAAK